MKCPITKIENPIRNLLFPALVFVVLSKAFGFLIYGQLFADVWAPYKHLWRDMSDNSVCYYMSAIDLFFGFLISAIYCKKRMACSVAEKEKCCLFSYAFFVFLLTRFTGELYMFAMSPISLDVALIGMAHGFLTLMIWALISKKIFKV